MSLQYEVLQISTAQTLELRQRVMKPFFTAAECVNDGDELPTTCHFGLLHHGKLISISTFVLESHPAFFAGHPYRLRGMATESRFQGQGWGQILLHHGLSWLKDIRCDLLWCNARQRAFSFYTELGFQTHGPLFEIPPIGPHKVMYKILIPR